MGSMSGITRRSKGGHPEHLHMAFEMGQER
jgi:hypothetical protein